MIPRWVEQYLHVPFVDRGRAMRGADCLGLVAIVLEREAHVSIPDYGFIGCDDHQRIAMAIAKAKQADDQWRPWPIREARVFDVVPMTTDDREPDHLGVMVSPFHVLHTERGSGPSVNDISGYAVKYRLEPNGAPTVWRFRGLWT
jgi:cell wall-associated NlpC family hydrolase